MPTLTPEPSARYGIEASDFFCMPFDRVLQLVHVDEVYAAAVRFLVTTKEHPG
jgi:hypothetical protein